jgi:hypothetical protein
VAEVLQVTGNPVFVSPDAPAGVQKAPAVTSFTIATEALGVGDATSDGVSVGVGDGDATTSDVGVGVATGFETSTPLFQTNLPLDLTHVYFMLFEIFTEFSGLHEVPDLTAPKALEGIKRLIESKTTNETFFILALPLMPLCGSQKDTFHRQLNLQELLNRKQDKNASSYL